MSARVLDAKAFHAIRSAAQSTSRDLVAEGRRLGHADALSEIRRAQESYERLSRVAFAAGDVSRTQQHEAVIDVLHDLAKAIGAL